MHPGRPLPELATELYRQANAKRDFVARARDMHVHTNGHTHLVLNEGFALNGIGHGQLADYLGIPRAFYDRLRSASEDLLLPYVSSQEQSAPTVVPLFDVMVNRLLQSKDADGRLIRTLDGTARAVLSDSYYPDLDNFDVYKVAAQVIEQHGLGPENVLSADVTERKLYIKVVSPRLQATVTPDNLGQASGAHHFLKEPQVVQAGFIISNSETGLGALCVQQVVYKLMCTNMWIMETAYRQRHLGRTLEADADGAIYRDETRQADAKARLLKLRDQVTDVMDQHRFLSTVERMQDAANTRLGNNIERVMEVTARKFGLTQTERDMTLGNLIEGADISLWGLSNAITATAQAAENYDRATELETIGGRCLTAPAGDIRDMVRAA